MISCRLTYKTWSDQENNGKRKGYGNCTQDPAPEDIVYFCQDGKDNETFEKRSKGPVKIEDHFTYQPFSWMMGGGICHKTQQALKCLKIMIRQTPDVQDHKGHYQSRNKTWNKKQRAFQNVFPGWSIEIMSCHYD